MLQILHNPRCGKSRNCLAFLENNKATFEIRNYIQNPLSEEELKTVIQKLAIKPIALVRQKEAIWIDQFKDKTMSDNEVIRALTLHPILMERPIVIKDNKAIIGRDLEKLEKFL
ncbi:ArsC/Spx/MgsR family protein [Flavobacterium buctense]|uniref:ArsC/Spx/MgsR family protein n=1 Tax=Flavobacterium buctense TaxID=1648146 RepID=A0ABU9E263_9FLAO|nr:ArsC/Spx/MgsR family protein [Flavobacterium buctense]